LWCSGGGGRLFTGSRGYGRYYHTRGGLPAVDAEASLPTAARPNDGLPLTNSGRDSRGLFKAHRGALSFR